MRTRTVSFLILAVLVPSAFSGCLKKTTEPDILTTPTFSSPQCSKGAMPVGSLKELKIINDFYILLRLYGKW